MQISLITDEISADPETALELGIEWGVRNFELRGVGTYRAPLLPDFYKQRLQELLEEYDARVVALSPGLFKCPYPSRQRERFPLQAIDAALYQRWHEGRSLVQYQIEELLPASLEYARKIGAHQIVAFGFHRGSAPPGPAPDEVLETLQRAAQLAETAGLGIAIEVEDQFWADTGRRTADMVRAINSPALGVNWDPGNAFVAGDIPYPDGYQAVRHYVRHVHFKDVIHATGGEFRYAVQGEIDWAGQIQALAQDGYPGFISVEPHLQPKVASAQAALHRLRTLIESTLTQEQR